MTATDVRDLVGWQREILDLEAELVRARARRDAAIVDALTRMRVVDVAAAVGVSVRAIHQIRARRRGSVTGTRCVSAV